MSSRDRPSHRDDRDRRDRDRGSDRKPYTAADRERERDYERRKYDEDRRRSRSPDDRRGGGEVRRYGERKGGNESAGPVSERSPKEPPKSIEPNFAQSGALAAETNTLNGVVLKYNEPPEARKPTLNWRLYVFKGDEQVDLHHIHRQSAYLVGRDTAVVDITIPHPSCSKQHSAFQFRQINERNEFGDSKSVIKPFIIDLESTNGTFVNGKEIPTSRYYELKASDVIKFGQSTREYVLLHEEAS